ncbi:unnamed protein product [Phytomonas sp. Hart1]|nr:unnamed protein product [Phytomonas sp. Hart1]|eukprot:CCW69919.1 unnamed protein product [Phytomonas sp. isolate Hart1]
MVVAEYPLNKNMHMGIVSAITTVRPATFYTEGNDDPNYLTDEEMGTLPRLIRHARDHDKDTKLEMRRYDLNSLENACRLAEEMQAPVTFLDAEWLMGMNVITFLVHVYGDVTKVDDVATELARLELAEVVFTFPAGSTESS